MWVSEGPLTPDCSPEHHEAWVCTQPGCTGPGCASGGPPNRRLQHPRGHAARIGLGLETHLGAGASGAEDGELDALSPPPPATRGSCCRRAPSHQGPKSSRPPRPVPSSPAAPATAGDGTALQAWKPPAMPAAHPHHPLWGRSPGVQAKGGGSFQGWGEGVESRSQRWLPNVVNVLTSPCDINPTLQFSSQGKMISFDVLMI